jgi:hypothetical protein
LGIRNFGKTHANSGFGWEKSGNVPITASTSAIRVDIDINIGGDVSVDVIGCIRGWDWGWGWG